MRRHKAAPRMRPRSYAPLEESWESESAAESTAESAERAAECAEARARRVVVVHRHYFVPPCREGFPPWYIFGGPLCRPIGRGPIIVHF